MESQEGDNVESELTWRLTSNTMTLADLHEDDKAFDSNQLQLSLYLERRHWAHCRSEMRYVLC